ncbi:hypothetical protein [Pantoea ananatis]|uniref:hypothetical protein n=1 Tax=Pantoea ananas TaxID=553 RepID=UPI001B3072CD|nr:hypothetical protein [Pantoea ananatis]
MERFVSAIRKSSGDKNWFGALFMALAMPDICGALETPEVRNGVRYRRWFDENLKSKYVFETAYDTTKLLRPHEIERLEKTADEDPQSFRILEKLKNHNLPESLGFTAQKCWALRNSCLHSGMSKDDKKRFAFIPPHECGGGSHMIFIEETLVIRIDRFCEDVCCAVDIWFEENKDDVGFMMRVGELMEVTHSPFPGVVFNKG